MLLLESDNGKFHGCFSINNSIVVHGNRITLAIGFAIVYTHPETSCNVQLCDIPPRIKA